MSCSDSDDDSADEPDDQMIDVDAQMDCGAWLVDGESDEGDEDHYVDGESDEGDEDHYVDGEPDEYDAFQAKIRREVELLTLSMHDFQMHHPWDISLWVVNSLGAAIPFRVWSPKVPFRVPVAIFGNVEKQSKWKPYVQS